MGKLSRFWQDQDISVKDQLLTKKNPDYVLPDYVNGDFLSSGPSKWTMGNRSHTHVLDGFGRMSRYKIKDGEISFTSSLLECKWLKKCRQDNDLVPGLGFRGLSPPRWEQKVPFVSLYYTAEYFDDNWVMPWRLPDGTYVSMTDTPNYLQLDIDTLEPQGMVKFDDDIKGQTGTTHVRSHPNGDTVGVVSE